MKSAIIENLKHLLADRTEKEVLPFSLLPCGITRGAITEISGTGKTEFVLHFLKENPELKIAWIEKSFSAYPFAFLQKEIDLKRILFIDGQKDLDWCVYQALRSQAFQSVVVYCENLSLKSLRRIQLHSEKSLASTIWLTDEPKSAWPVSLRLHVERGDKGELRPTVLKRRPH